jgi:hypothetical protein
VRKLVERAELDHAKKLKLIIEKNCSAFVKRSESLIGSIEMMSIVRSSIRLLYMDVN